MNLKTIYLIIIFLLGGQSFAADLTDYIQLSSTNKHNIIVANTSPATISIRFITGKKVLLQPGTHQEFYLDKQMKNSPSFVVFYESDNYVKDIDGLIDLISKTTDYPTQLEDIRTDTENFNINLNDCRAIFEEYRFRDMKTVLQVVEDLYLIKSFPKASYNQGDFSNEVNYKSVISDEPFTDQIQLSFGLNIFRGDLNDDFLKGKGPMFPYDIQFSYMFLGDYSLGGKYNMIGLYGFANWKQTSYGFNEEKGAFYANAEFTKDNNQNAIDNYEFVSLTFRSASLGSFLRYGINNTVWIDAGAGFNLYNNVQIHFKGKGESEFDQTHRSTNPEQSKFKSVGKYDGSRLYGVLQLSYRFPSSMFLQAVALFDNSMSAVASNDYELYCTEPESGILRPMHYADAGNNKLQIMIRVGFSM